MECLEQDTTCRGTVELREVPGREVFGLAPRAFPRCDHHFELAVERAQETTRRYGSVSAPSDFDPLYAGEAWGEEDY